MFIEPLQQLQQNLWLALTVFAVLGLCVGSFLNVVIHRMPLMMRYEWRHEIAEFLSYQEDIDEPVKMSVSQAVAKDTRMTLSSPASRCPHCEHRIRWYENIPVISWLMLRGKCGDCHAPISIRYPLVEIITAVLSVLVIHQFGVSSQGICALMFVWILIALTGIDFDTQYLPDRLVYPLMGIGLAVNSFDVFVSPITAIWGLLFGFLSLWVVAKGFYLIMKKQGMGQGDFKLLAALGAWLGVSMLPFIIFTSALLGSMIGLVLMKVHGESRPFAFGPYLAMAGILALLFGNDILNWYLSLYA